MWHFYLLKPERGTIAEALTITQTSIVDRMPEANKLSIAEAHARIRAGTLTPVQLADACLARESDVRARVHVDADYALPACAAWCERHLL